MFVLFVYSLVSELVERRPASRRGFRVGCCPPAASHRLWRQLNDELSACRRCWRFGNGLSNMITLQVPRSLALVGVVICSVGHYCRCDTSGGHDDKCETSGVTRE